MRTYTTFSEGSDICDLAFSPDGNRIAIVTDHLQLFSVHSEEAEEGFEPSPLICRTIRFSVDGKVIYTLLEDGTTVRIDAATGKQVDEWPIPDGLEISTPLALAKDGLLAAGTDDIGSLHVWNPRTGKLPDIQRLCSLEAPWISSDGKQARCVDVQKSDLLIRSAFGQTFKIYRATCPD